MGKKLFTFVIGNPPYQEDTAGTSDKPVYNIFMDGVYTVTDKVMLIHPARFLFNAGKTPRAWNERMLADPHFKVEHYEQNSDRIFPNTDIKGGIAITYRDGERNFGAIGIMTVFPELNTIISKIKANRYVPFSELVYAPESYRFTEILHKENPSVISLLSRGHPYDLTSNIFDKLDGIVFSDNRLSCDKGEYIRIFGRKNGARTYRWIDRRYVCEHLNLNAWKVFLPKSNGSGALGEALSTPLVGQPLVGHTQSFISVGAFDSEFEANACMSYIKSKFARVLLGVLKVTQDNKKAVWRYVPIQDFTPSSDIDWSKPIHEIDLQLYRKYGLSEDEIEFIESHVKEMA